ncbi:hypothetical protein AGMMS49546_33350 [Spirochaetia bacterium]|nr:hypothetical protein AGMMS49546_33350 [Spirochaetia bacterium]
MLKSWQVSNFKSIHNMDKPLEFAPLTIFCGANSSGKSSLLQSILLFKQSMEKKEIRAPRMVLNGGLVQLGGMNDIITNGLNEEKDNIITCSFQIEESCLKFEDWLRIYHPRDFEKFINDFKMPYKYGYVFVNKLATSVKCCVSFGISTREKYEHKTLSSIENISLNLYPRFTSIIITDTLNDRELINCIYLDDQAEFPFVGGYMLQGEGAGFHALYRLRKADIQKYLIGADKKTNDFYKKNYMRLSNTLQAFDCFLPKVVFDNKYHKESGELYERDIDSISDFFCKQLYYVGPLRADPKENNDTTSQFKGVGYRGEYTSACFALHASNDLFTYSNGDNLDFPCVFGKDANPKDYDNKITGKLRDISEDKINWYTTSDLVAFKHSLYEWINYIGVAEEVDTNDRGELIIKQGNGKWSSLKNVGIGVSQVLPIIIQCIIAPPDSTIIIEQPELHLHPKMQSRLADFFLSMSLLGKQLIIETHSEYIIDKLRLRIVQAPLNVPINDKVAIYFAEKKDGYSEFRRIHLNEYSVMSEWPEGFFEESMQTAREIMSAIRQKRREGGKDEEDDD